MHHLYVISGLGIDERAFEHINFGNNIVTHINWIAPPKDISIQAYAQLLSKKITTPNAVLIGLSFGGIMAIEVAKLISVSKIILLSSVKTKAELPFWMKLCGYLQIHYVLKVLPITLFKTPNFLVYKAFGLTNEKDRIVLRNIMKDIDPTFLRWALQQVACWQNTVIPNNIFHIHGNKDGLFPISKISHAIEVKNAGHFMVRNKYEEVNEALLPLLSN